MAQYAFTNSYEAISNRLINSAVIIYNGKECHTDLAQWDTGATNTCISKNIVRQLGLIPTGMKPVKTPSGENLFNEYRVDIKLQNQDVLLKNVFVLDSEIGEQGIDVLIGMDIIGLGDFAVSNFNGKTTFTFRTPSQATTDYVQLIQASNPIKKTEKIYPNNPCPCGSGKKYKKCCGRK